MVLSDLDMFADSFFSFHERGGDGVFARRVETGGEAERLVDGVGGLDGAEHALRAREHLAQVRRQALRLPRLDHVDGLGAALHGSGLVALPFHLDAVQFERTLFEGEA